MPKELIYSTETPQSMCYQTSKKSFRKTRQLIDDLKEFAEYIALLRDKIVRSSQAPLDSTQAFQYQSVNDLRNACTRLIGAIDIVMRSAKSSGDKMLPPPGTAERIVFDKWFENFFESAMPIRENGFFGDLTAGHNQGKTLAACLNTMLNQLVLYYPKNNVEKGYYQDEISEKSILRDSTVVFDRYIADLSALNDYLHKRVQEDTMIANREPYYYCEIQGYYKERISSAQCLTLFTRFQEHELNLITMPVLLQYGAPLDGSYLNNPYTVFLMPTREVVHWGSLRCTIIPHASLACCSWIQEIGGSLGTHVIPFIQYLSSVRFREEEFAELFEELKTDYNNIVSRCLLSTCSSEGADNEFLCSLLSLIKDLVPAPIVSDALPRVSYFAYVRKNRGDGQEGSEYANRGFSNRY